MHAISDSTVEEKGRVWDLQDVWVTGMKISFMVIMDLSSNCYKNKVLGKGCDKCMAPLLQSHTGKFSLHVVQQTEVIQAACYNACRN
jgi:hypothetical protein